jgi:hypothetical protein
MNVQSRTTVAAVRRIAGPSDEVLDRGFKIVSIVEGSADAPGSIFDSMGGLLWRFHTEPRTHAWSIRNLRQKPEFVVSDPGGSELLRIRREVRFPPTFQMTQSSRVAGYIRLTSVLRNSYVIVLSDGATWRFRMPLYTVLFHGASETGSEVWVSVGPGGKKHWNILLDGNEDQTLVVSAIAFIHREWWCYA